MPAEGTLSFLALVHDHLLVTSSLSAICLPYQPVEVTGHTSPSLEHFHPKCCPQRTKQHLLCLIFAVKEVFAASSTHQEDPLGFLTILINCWYKIRTGTLRQGMHGIWICIRESWCGP